MAWRKAAIACDRTKFMDSVALMTLHMEGVTAKWDLYYKYIAMSKKQWKKHLTIIVDGIDKSKVESPVQRLQDALAQQARTHSRTVCPSTYPEND